MSREVGIKKLRKRCHVWVCRSEDNESFGERGKNAECPEGGGGPNYRTDLRPLLG